MYISWKTRYIRYIVDHQLFKVLHFPLQGRYKPLQPLHFSRAGDGPFARALPAAVVQGVFFTQRPQRAQRTGKNQEGRTPPMEQTKYHLIAPV